MATIRKQGVHPNPPSCDHIGEDKSFGRAAQSVPSQRRPGLNPHNAIASDEPIDADAVPALPVMPTPGHTCH